MPMFDLKRGPKKKRVQEVLGIDLASSSLKVVRVKRGRDGPVVVNAEILPVFRPNPKTDDPDKQMLRSALPKTIVTKFAAVALTGEQAAIRYVSLPGKVDASADVEAQLREHMGLEGDYRLSYVVTGHARKKEAETRLLTAALPEGDAQSVLEMLSASTPAVVGIEVAGLSALNAFYGYGPLAEHEGDAVGVVECGARVTLLALFNKQELCLVRKFNIGGEALVAKIQKQMDVAREVAEGIVSNGSFDISQAVQDVIDPFLRQLSISKDFVERRESCHISTLYLSGGMSLSRYWVDRIRAASGVDVVQWHPLGEGCVGEGALSDEIVGQEARLTSAFGAAAGALE